MDILKQRNKSRQNPLKRWLFKSKTLRILFSKKFPAFQLDKPLPKSLAINFDNFFFDVYNISDKFNETTQFEKLMSLFKTEKFDTIFGIKYQNQNRIRHFIFLYLIYWQAFNFLRYVLYLLFYAASINDETFLIYVGDVFQFVGAKRYFTHLFLSLLIAICTVGVFKFRTCRTPSLFKWLDLVLTLKGSPKTSLSDIGIKTRKEAIKFLKFAAFLSILTYVVLWLTVFAAASTFGYLVTAYYDFENLLIFGIPTLLVNLTWVYLGCGSFLVQFSLLLLCVYYLRIRYKQLIKYLLLIIGTNRPIYAANQINRSKRKEIVKILLKFEKLTNFLENYNKFFSTFLGTLHYLILPSIAFNLYITIFVEMPFFIKCGYLCATIDECFLYSALTLIVSSLPTFLNQCYYTNTVLQISDPSLKLKIQTCLERIASGRAGFRCFDNFTITRAVYVKVVLNFISSFLLVCQLAMD